ncbi:MAG TPA: acyl-CoA dehydrogenase family protein [Mycobacteriales bacterium]|nr:acyl-CoA dehydrogenase family protein [Mycobacteriales bacterium]
MADPEEFRARLRDWLARVDRPEGLHDYGPTPTVDDVPAGRAWQRLLADAGYACLHWPAEYGGPAASVAEQAVFAEETARAGFPRQLNIMGPDLVGPVIMKFGTPAQRATYLEPIRTGEHLWCQLFSEPGAGSDLASLRTRARPEGEFWVIDGQKVWTSAAQCSELGILLARTGAGHGGITAFIVDMALPGITVRPLRQMDGESKFNEVFLDGLRLPDSARLGAVGGGWSVATATLGRERLSLGANSVGQFRALTDIADAARQRGSLDPLLRDELVHAWIRVWLLRATWLRALGGGGDLTSTAFSVLKLISSGAQRDIGELGLAALGEELTAGDRHRALAHRLLIGPAQTILGGTTEIQRNVLAERVLDLPREPRTREVS